MDLLFLDLPGEPLWTWRMFLALVLGLLGFDLGVPHRKAHEIGVRESLRLSAKVSPTPQPVVAVDGIFK